jgi:uncharacterized damage-inducible protein DinB
MDLRYPIGKFQFSGSLTAEDRAAGLRDLAETPARLRLAVAGLSEAQLDTPYREGGWTVRQVIHHMADSHINSYIRFRLALTEDNPPAKGYDEKAWAQLIDAATAPVETSLGLLDALHSRWVMLLQSLGPAELSRTFIHSQLGPVTLDRNLVLYAWHGRHHIAHITALRERMGW